MTFDNCKYNNLKCLCICTVHVLSLSLLPFGNSVHQIHQHLMILRERKGGRERERKKGRERRGREGEGEVGRKKALKILHVSLTFWNDFILTVSRRIR